MSDAAKPTVPTSNAPGGTNPVNPNTAENPVPRATRAGSKPHLQRDAKFKAVHSCAISCSPGDKNIERKRFRPMAPNLSNEAIEEATNDVIERLLSKGAIILMTEDEVEAEEEALTKPV